jgi:ribosomal protein S18 acetylase RimI-like enzyme
VRAEADTSAPTRVSGEIGIHAALRWLCRKAWRFKSSLTHHIMTEKYPRAEPRLVESNIPRKRIYHGLDDNLSGQLISKSRHAGIFESTPKDALERFNNPDMLAAWLSQGRDVYALTSGTRLAGVAWYGEKPLPIQTETIDESSLPHHTFAIRIYQPYQGKGLAEPLMRDSLKDYIGELDSCGQVEGFKGLWLSTRHDNIPARQLYNKFGYKDVAFSQGEVIMVLPPPKIVEALGL